MAETPACREARTALQWVIVGAPISEAKIDRVFAHLARCEECWSRFRFQGDLKSELAEPAEVAETKADIDELFERAMTAALSDRDAAARIRAAERLGGFDSLGPAALAALADAAGEDREEDVREAALRTLDLLDEAVSIPQRLIEAWSIAPAEAADFIAGVLARLSSEGPLANPGVVGLAGSATHGGEEVALSGRKGMSGLIREEQHELRLELNKLPASFDKTKPVVALPEALAEDAPPIKWSGEEPGLVPAPNPVADGSLEVRLGEAAEPPEWKLFEHVYLLNPEESRKRH